MDDEQRSLMIRSSSHYSSSPGLELRYGARGFVGDASVLRAVAYRVGILAALRSLKSKSVTGVMITACGGSVEENGVRIVDPDGGALIADWEILADSIANAVDPDELVAVIEEGMKKENISFDGGQPAEVLLGWTPSGESLLEAAKQGISSVAGTIFQDLGILTPSQLHWLVNARNKGMKASEQEYFQQLSISYRCLVDLIPKCATADKIGESLVVDGANGVGGDKLEVLRDLCGLEIEIRNKSRGGAIHNQVGVDFIREQKIVPSGFGSSDIGFRCASLDGDADRFLYFAVLPSHKEIEIVDGDKILFLFALFINEQLSVFEEFENEKEEGHYHARLAILQRGYENGASTNCRRRLGFDVVSCPPGTRSLYAEASKYDIGIYFEADGHGGILFSDNYLCWLEAKNNDLLSSSKGSRRQLTVSRLLAVNRLMNPTVSDAMAGLLLVEAILQHNGWSMQKWNEIYCDLINRQLNAVELEEKMTVATENPKIVADSLSGTKEEADALIDEAISEESKHIDTGPNDSAVQQVVDYGACAVEQTDVDASVEVEECQEQETTTCVQAYETETHTGLLEEFQESHQSQIVSLHSDETADENELEASAEEEESQDSSINTEQGVSLESNIEISEDSCPSKVLEVAEDPDHVKDKETFEIKRGESDDGAWVLVSDGKVDSLNAGPVMSETKDYEHLPELDEPCNEKESCSSPRVNGILALAENVDDLLVSADTDKAEEAGVSSDSGSACDAQPQLQTSNGDTDKPQTSNEKESCSSPKVNGIRAPAENLDDLLVSADTDNFIKKAGTDKAEEAEVSSGTESACDAQPQPQMSSGDIDKPQPSNEKESDSSPKVSGILAPVENADDLLVSVIDKAEEAEFITCTESAFDAKPQPQVSSGDTDKPQPSNEKETCSSPKVNGILAPVKNVDDLLVSEPIQDLLVSANTDKAEEAGVISGTESACDAQPQPQAGSGDTDKLQPSDEKESCSSPKVNGVLAPAENLDDLLVSADRDKAEEAGVISGTDSACVPQPQPQASSGDRFPSVIVHDKKLEADAHNGSVDADNGSNCLVNGTSFNAVSVSSCSDGNDVSVPSISGEASPTLSDVGAAEETGDLNVVEYASHTVAPQVNGIAVVLPSFDQAAKVEAKAENSHVDVDNGSNYLVSGENSDTRISFSSSEVNVEAPVETLENLPIPSDVGESEEAGATNDGVGMKPPYDMGQTEETGATNDAVATLVHDKKLDSDAENVGVVENEIDVNIPVPKAEGPSNPDDVVQAERSVADGAGTANLDSEVNGGINGFATVQVAEPGVKTENGPDDVENKSENTIDNTGVSTPCVNKTAEIELTNEFECVPDIQPPSHISGNSVGLYESAHHGELDNQAENSSLDAHETETLAVADGAAPQFQVSNHNDAQETYLSKAESSSVNGDKRSDSLVGSVSVNTNIRFGSLEFVRNTCPKSTGSRDVAHHSSNLGKAEGNIRVKESFDEINGRQHVASSHCEHKVEDTLVQGSSDFPRDDPATEGDINGGIALNGLVPTVGTIVDKESTSSRDGSATAGFDGESAGEEPVKKPFYYLIKIPKYDDEKLTEQIRLAEIQLEEKTRSRDAVLTEYRLKKETCQKLRADQQAAILEERAARDLFRAKRKETESAQLLVNIAKDAMTIEDLDNKIANMEHTIQHETVPLSEEKKLIREIKQSKQMRDQLLLATTKKQGVQQALDQKDKNEDRVKVLRKEMDALKFKLSEAEHVVIAAMKRLDSEHAILNELHRRLTLSNDVRQEAYSNLQILRSQWSDKNKFFWSFKNVQRQAISNAVSGDKASLQSLCVNQVESLMKLWNLDNDFRRDYKRCNLRSTLRRLGTSDGRSLGPDEEPPSLTMAPVCRINAPVRDSKVSRAAAAEPEPVAEPTKADTKSANKVVEQKKPNAVTSKPTKVSPSKNEEAEASDTVKIEEDKEDLKAKKEDEEMARKAEALRKEKEAVRLKEVRRLEEKAKFQEALERKRKQAEKAQAKAELKARKEAKEKEKEREKRARKKENKRGLSTADDTTSNPDSEAATNPDGPSEPTKELETREKSVTLIKRAQKPYAKQNKLKTILPPPPPLRNRGKRRMRQWMWVPVTVLAVLALFFLGNLNLREISGVFSSWH